MMISQLLAKQKIDAQAIYNRVLIEAMEKIGAERGQLLAVHPDYLTVEATTGKEKLGSWVSLNSSFCGHFVVKTGKAHIADDLRNPRYRSYYINFLGKENTQMLSELAVPIYNDDNVIGVLNFESPEANAFSYDKASLLQQYVNEIAIALARAADAKKLSQLEKFRYAQDKIKHYLTADPFIPEEVYDSILEQSLSLIGGQQGQLLLVHPDKLTILSTTAAEPRGTEVPTDISFVWKFVVETGNYAIASDLRDSRYKSAYVDYLGKPGEQMLSEISVPIFLGSEMLGVINVESPKTDAFDEADMRVLKTLANDAAIALRQAAAVEFNIAFREMAQELAEANIAVDELLLRIVKRCLRLLKAVSGQFLGVEGEWLKILAWAGLRPPENLELRFDNSITGLAAQSKRPVRVDDVNAPKWANLYQGFPENTKSELAIPLLRSGTVIGVLNMESSRVAAFTEFHEEMLGSFSHLIALGYQRRQYEENQRNVLHAMKNRLGQIKSQIRYIIDAVEKEEVPKLKDCTFLQLANEILMKVALNATEQPNILPVEVIESINEFLDTYAYSGDVEFVGPEVAVHSEFLPIVAADPDFLRKTLTLLVDNAIKAIDDAKPEKPRVVFEVTDVDDYVYIHLEDNGTGIDPQIFPYMFEGVVTPKHVTGTSGTGIGLPDARQMMHKMLGGITVEWTEQGKGTRIAISLRKMSGLALVKLAEKPIEKLEEIRLFVFSKDEMFKQLTKSFCNRYKLNNSVDISQSDTSFIDVFNDVLREPSYLLIDFRNNNQDSIRFYLEINDYIQIQNSKGSKVDEYLSLYPIWNTPIDESHMLELIKYIREEAPKGYLK